MISLWPTVNLHIGDNKGNFYFEFFIVKNEYKGSQASNPKKLEGAPSSYVLLIMLRHFKFNSCFGY